MRMLKRNKNVFLTIFSIVCMVIMTCMTANAQEDDYYLQTVWPKWTDWGAEEGSDADYGYIVLGDDKGNPTDKCIIFIWNDIDENVVFPSEYKGYKVVQIGQGAAQGFTSSEGEAENNYTTKHITIPPDATVGNNTFCGYAALESITIPKSVTDIWLTDFMCYDETTYEEYVIYLKDIYYEGTKEDWEKIKFLAAVADPSFAPDPFKYANIHFEEYTYEEPVAKTDLSTASVNGMKSTYVVTGKEIVPAFKVVLNGVTLVKGKDYDVVCTNNKKTGIANVSVIGKGLYKGKITKTFKIVPKTIKKVSLKYTKGTLKISWTGDKKNVSGYEILVSTNKQFTSKTTKKYTVGANATSKIVKSVKKNKTYYAKVRAYKKIGNNKIYGKYSGVAK
ncbi:MAG: fibronectin type III domain-containing protein [Eubacteriales bacterium]|nr:fibronectin type III domain-containing protein [Eubacteriales bacterium]